MRARRRLSWPPKWRRRFGRASRAVSFLLVGGLLAGYVPAPAKVLQRWTESPMRPNPSGLVALPVRSGEVVGELLVAAPGEHALSLAGQPPRFDRGPGKEDPLAGLWIALDLFCLSAQDLPSVLAVAGLDLDRAGYARTPQSRDGVAFTLGAKGEGEAGLPQLWFSREPLWPVQVRMAGGGPVAIGPRGADGWPAWFLLEGERVEVVGPPRALDRPPPWVYERRLLLPEGPRDEPPEDWRRAFETQVRP